VRLGSPFRRPRRFDATRITLVPHSGRCRVCPSNEQCVLSFIKEDAVPLKAISLSFAATPATFRGALPANRVVIIPMVAGPIPGPDALNALPSYAAPCVSFDGRGCGVPACDPGPVAHKRPGGHPQTSVPSNSRTSQSCVRSCGGRATGVDCRRPINRYSLSSDDTLARLLGGWCRQVHLGDARPRPCAKASRPTPRQAVSVPAGTHASEYAAPPSPLT
jgi:hypothetical protein